MPVIRVIRDSDIDYMGENGRITIRGHPLGHKGILILGRDTCPFCRQAYAMSERVCSRYADPSPIYKVDITDPACGIAARTWKPRGVPHFVRVNRLGRVDLDELQVDFTNEVAFLGAVRRAST